MAVKSTVPVCSHCGCKLDNPKVLSVTIDNVKTVCPWCFVEHAVKDHPDRWTRGVSPTVISCTMPGCGIVAVNHSVERRCPRCRTHAVRKAPRPPVS